MLAAVGQAFVDDPELDAVYANAAYVDSEGRPTLTDHGIFRSGFCHGTFEKRTGASSEFPFWEDPSLWSVLELAR